MIKCQVIEDEVRKTIKKVVLLSPTEEEILAELQSGKLSAHVNIVYENLQITLELLLVISLRRLTKV